MKHLVNQRPLVFDIDLLSRSKYTFRDSNLQIEIDSEWFELGSETFINGWFRRLAPQDWQTDVQIGSKNAAEKAAWLGLLGAISRKPNISWLTGIDNCLIAESKLRQIEAAKRLKIRIPRTTVSNQLSEVANVFPGEMIIKPLGPGNFFEGGLHHVIYTNVVTQGDLSGLAKSPPMLIQEKLQATSHLRVVVVRDRVWAAELDARDLPVDWRSTDRAHSSFIAISPPTSVATEALLISAELELGYSSQDWVVTKDGAYLVDVNPGGQWMFLPEAITEEVSKAIAHWLRTPVSET